MTDLHDSAKLLPFKQPSYATIDSTSEADSLTEPETKQKSSRIVTILFGQLIAVLATSTNAASFTIEYGMGKGRIPMFLMFPAYLLLSFHLWTRPIISDDSRHMIPLISVRIRKPWWQYICLSILDILPNYLTLLSLNHTSLTSATLLGSLTVPSTMIMCSIILGKRYGKWHYMGVILCLAGGALTIWTDTNPSSQHAREASHPHSYYGDILATLAALMYGVADAASEFWTKHIDRDEYLGMLGFHGAMATCFFSILFEFDDVVAAFSPGSSILISSGLAFWYAASLATFYIVATLFLVSSDATLLTLSLQSSNLWAILYSTIAFQESPSIVFFTAVVLVVTGATVYELFGNAKQSKAEKLTEEV